MRAYPAESFVVDIAVVLGVVVHEQIQEILVQLVQTHLAAVNLDGCLSTCSKLGEIPGGTAKNKIEKKKVNGGGNEWRMPAKGW